jgi:hypothetical protein
MKTRTKGCLDANPEIQPDEIARLFSSERFRADVPLKASPTTGTSGRRRKNRRKRRQQQERAQTLETAPRGILDSAARGEQGDAETLEWAKNVIGDDQTGPP